LPETALSSTAEMWVILRSGNHIRKRFAATVLMPVPAANSGCFLPFRHKRVRGIRIPDVVFSTGRLVEGVSNGASGIFNPADQTSDVPEQKKFHDIQTTAVTKNKMDKRRGRSVEWRVIL
jgi:hypothetical protein